MYSRWYSTMTKGTETMIDEVGKFWVVTRPGDTSVLEDILFEATVAEMGRQFRGGLDPRDILGLFTDKTRARAVAFDQLARAESLRLAAMSKLNDS